MRPPPAAPPAPAHSPSPAAAPTAPPVSSPANGAELWEKLGSVAPMMLRALLADMRLVRLTDIHAEIACAAHARPVAEKKLGDLSKLMSELTGRSITAVLSDAAPEPAEVSPAPSGPAPVEPDVDHPIVKKALELFNGRIIDVKPVRSKPKDTPGEI